MINLTAFRKHKGVGGVSFNETWPLNNVLEKLPVLTVEYEDELFAFTQSDLTFDIYDPNRDYAFLTGPDIFIELRNNNSTLYTGRVLNYDYIHKSKTMRLRTISISDVLNRTGNYIAPPTGTPYSPNFFNASGFTTLYQSILLLLWERTWLGYDLNDDAPNIFQVDFESQRTLVNVLINKFFLRVRNENSLCISYEGRQQCVGSNAADVIKELLYIMNLEMKLTGTQFVLRDREWNVQPVITLDDLQTEDIYEKTSKESFSGVRITTPPTADLEDGRIAEVGSMVSPLELELKLINYIYVCKYSTNLPGTHWTFVYRENLIQEVAQNLYNFISTNSQYIIDLHGLNYSIFNSYHIPYLGKDVKPKKLVYDFDNETTKMTCIG